MSADQRPAALNLDRPAGSRRLQGGPIPLYHQLEVDLLRRIRSSEFGPGDTLPTEEAICEDYGVSRITVRRALEALIQQGLIVRRRGVGSFVAPRPEGVRSVRLSGSLDDFLLTAGVLHPKVLSMETVPPTAEVRVALELSDEEREVVHLQMLSSLSTGPVLYLDVYFPLAIGRHLRKADLGAGVPVVRVIERKLKLRVARAHQLIEPDLASQKVARHLGIKPDTPILRIRRVYYTATGRPIETVILRHHPDRYQYEIEFRAQPADL